jgi:hypothetical protein
VSWGNLATVADLGTALGTLILAVATFSAVKSANLTARVAQQSLLVGLRPVLMSSRREDPTQKVNFRNIHSNHHIHVLLTARCSLSARRIY